MLSQTTFLQALVAVGLIINPAKGSPMVGPPIVSPVVVPADKIDMYTTQEGWDESLYDDDTESLANQLRDIFDSDEDRQTYFEHMSQAMAYLCETYAQVMTNDVNNIPMDGIWGRIEFTALTGVIGQVGKTVDKIDAIEGTGNNRKNIWQRQSGEAGLTSVLGTLVGAVGAAGGLESLTASTSKPSTQSSNCGVGSDVAAVFDKGGKLEVNW